MQDRLREQLSRHPRLGVAGAVGAIVLVGVAVGLAIGAFGARPTADASPTPHASANPSASPSSTSPEPSASAPDDDLLLQVSVDGLRMRATASTSADIVRTLDRGEVVRVMSGPVEAAGYTWYEVVDLDSQSGWVAMGDGGAPWLEAVPAEPATSELLLRLERDCDVSGPALAPPELTITADGRVVLGSGIVRQLSPAGSARVQTDVLDSPYLQASADYRLERRPDTPDPPGHGLCLNSFTLGEGDRRFVVTAVNWQGDEEEAAYWIPSPARHDLDELAIHLLDAEAWLGPDAWSEPVAHRYVSSSYLFWLDPPTDTPPQGIDAPSVAGAAWPFDGPIEQFGDRVGQARCGDLNLRQAFETLRLMRELEVPTQAVAVDPPRPLSLDGFGYGNLGSDAGWFFFWLTPRSPDGYPSCAD